MYRYNTVASKCIQDSKSQLDQLSCLTQMKSNVQTNFIQADGTHFTFGWNEPLAVNGEIVQDEQNYPRYDNDFAYVPWGSEVFNISSIEGHFMYLDFDNLTQIVGL